MEPERKTDGELKSLAKSFRYAVSGVCLCLRTERNLRIHTVAAVFAIVLACLEQLPRYELLAVVLCIPLVITAELFNTALEQLVDIASPRYSEKARVAKDISAGAVFVSALFSAGVGAMTMLPLNRLRCLLKTLTGQPIWIGVLLLMLLLGLCFIFLFKKRRH